jgi:hypothetical protein
MVINSLSNPDYRWEYIDDNTLTLSSDDISVTIDKEGSLTFYDHNANIDSNLTLTYDYMIEISLSKDYRVIELFHSINSKYGVEKDDQMSLLIDAINDK